MRILTLHNVSEMAFYRVVIIHTAFSDVGVVLPEARHVRVAEDDQHAVDVVVDGAARARRRLVGGRAPRLDVHLRAHNVL